MELKKYYEEIQRTMIHLGYDANIIHMQRGMITELAELIDALKKKDAYNKPIDVVNIIEELGDFMWYFGNYVNVTKSQTPFESFWIPKDSCFKNKLNENINNLLISISCLHTSDIFKYFCTVSSIFMEQYNFTFQQVLDANIAKLRKRYPNGFSQHDAINRNVGEEKLTLDNYVYNI